MGDQARFTEKTWETWLDPFHAVRMLLDAGLDDREQAVNWLKGRLRDGALRAGGWHLKLVGDSLTETEAVIGLYKVSAWAHVAAISWKDDFWISGDYTPNDPLDALLRRNEPEEFRHYLVQVRFDPGPITYFCQRAKKPLVEVGAGTISEKGAGGRPRKPFWDQLWPSIAADLYNGDLKPERQSDIEKAMHDWLSANGHDAGETTVRRAARALWRAISREDQI